MITQKIEDILPKLYHNFFPSLFKAMIPKETAATCEDCAMCQKPGRNFPNGLYFLPDTKCCTFHPTLPNYLIGGLLSDAELALEEGRRRIREKINHRIGVTPHGVYPPAKYRLLYEKSRSLAFGRNQALLCPYYEKEQGICTVWPFREATCATYYCKSVTGNEGHEFWTSLKKYLYTAENALVQYTLYKMGWDPQRIMTSYKIEWDSQRIVTLRSSDPPLTPEDLEEQPPSDETYQELWGRWVGHEEDFYKETYHLVAALTSEDFERFMGISSVIILDELKQKRQEMIATKLPKILKRNPNLQAHKVSDDDYALISYSPTNPLQVGSLFYKVLDFFDGRRSNEEVCRLIREQLKLELDENLLICLYQFRVLVAESREDFTSPDINSLDGIDMQTERSKIPIGEVESPTQGIEDKDLKILPMNRGGSALWNSVSDQRNAKMRSTGKALVVSPQQIISPLGSEIECWLEEKAKLYPYAIGYLRKSLEKSSKVLPFAMSSRLQSYFQRTEIFWQHFDEVIADILQVTDWNIEQLFNQPPVELTEAQPSFQAIKEKWYETPYYPVSEHLNYIDFEPALERARFILKHLNQLELEQEQTTFLDLGYGPGVLTSLILQTKPHWQGYGIDISFSCYNYAKKLLELKRVAERAHLIVGDVRQLPYPDKNFDVVIGMEVFEHIPDPREGLSEAVRALKPGGYAITAIPVQLPLKMHLYDFKDTEEVLELYRDVGLKVLDFQAKEYQLPQRKFIDTFALSTLIET